MAMKMTEKIKETTDFLLNKFDKPEVGIILGTGLGNLTNKINEGTDIPYRSIPNFLYPTVLGHTGSLVSGKLGKKNVLAMNGRFHYYEGYELSEITFPIRIMAELGIQKLIVTNAAGAINPKFSPGDLMIIEDHVNFTGINPLRGPNLETQGERFPDLSEAYNSKMIKAVQAIALKLNIKLQTGVYAWMTGPSYETPAEIKALSLLGVDAVGMSTVPEVIVANHCGLKTLGVSYITNMASGLKSGKLNHNSVLESAQKGQITFQNLVVGIVEAI